ncbi:MAG: glycosyltransferase family 4 protein [Acidimicrobiales bacterium]|nr:glycosyltransferase family 4 protein [Acidimicrobiales bacterium]
MTDRASGTEQDAAPSAGSRILLVTTRFPWRSETFIERKARALRAQGLDVAVAASQVYPQDPSLPAVPVVQLPRVRSPRTWTSTARAMLRDRDARSLAPSLVRHHDHPVGLLPVVAGHHDVVHFEFSGIAAAVADQLPQLAPVKLAVSCRGHAENVAPLHDERRRERLERVFGEMSLIHCVSDAMAATVRALGAPEERILVNRPAVDTDRWAGVGRVAPEVRGTADAPLRVLSVGRLNWQKGFDDALRAIAEAKAKGVAIHYRIAGQGPELEKLEFLQASLGLDAQVELLGWQSQTEVEAHLRWADAFFLPSLSEGISNSALEAMAAGVPVVSSSCGGMDEVFTTSSEGLLVEVGDTSAMAGALASLADPDRRRALADSGTTRARDAFDLSRQATVFADAYRALAGA